MYSLVSAIVKPVNSGGRWRAMDISNVSLVQLYNDFSEVIAILSNPALTSNVSFDIQPLRPDLGGLPTTFANWLISIGNTTLDTSASIPTINTRYANFSDAIRSGYKATPVDPDASITSVEPISERTALLLTKSGIDYAMMHQHVLANVNGFYHRTDYDTNGLYVIDGMKSCLQCNRNEVGLLSFLNLGNLSFLSITNDMIYTHLPEQQLQYNCGINTGQDLSNKTVMLVLGGYLHFLDNESFYRTSPTSFGIDFSYIPMIERYYESKSVIDLTGLNMESTPANPDQISVNNLFSDTVLRNYLQLSQTFLVVLDNEEIFLDHLELEQSPFIGTYTSYAQPIYPLMVGHGKHEVFWPRKESDRYSVNVGGSWVGRRNYATVKTRAQKSISKADILSKGYHNTQAFFQLIGSDFYNP